jgi:uncharacterized membrane protein
MKSILRNLRQQIQAVPRKIWFLPLILVFSFLLLSITITALRYSDPIQSIDKQLSFLALTSEETARTIISTLTGGLISLMVFSFSMVMLVLSQASAQFSPRLLPGLISQRQHQFVLGFYLGTIIYNLSVLARIGPGSMEQSVPLIAVLLAIIFGVMGLILFILFITTISNSVRIDTILNDLHNSTYDKLSVGVDDDHKKGPSLPEGHEDWTVVGSRASGYLLNIDLKDIKELCDEHDFKVKIIPYAGKFVLRKEDVMSLSKKVAEEIEEALLDCLHIAVQEDLKSNSLQGLQQIVEIAVKAMSPGINDPATAINAIDFLTSLLDRYLTNRPYDFVGAEEGNPLVWLTPRPLEELLFGLFSPLRTYCAGDVVVTRKIIYSLRQLHSISSLNKQDKKLLLNEIEKIKADALKKQTNDQDLKLIESL